MIGSSKAGYCRCEVRLLLLLIDTVYSGGFTPFGLRSNFDDCGPHPYLATLAVTQRYHSLFLSLSYALSIALLYWSFVCLPSLIELATLDLITRIYTLFAFYNGLLAS